MVLCITNVSDKPLLMAFLTYRGKGPLDLQGSLISRVKFRNICLLNFTLLPTQISFPPFQCKAWICNSFGEPARSAFYHRACTTMHGHFKKFFLGTSQNGWVSLRPGWSSFLVTAHKTERTIREPSAMILQTTFCPSSFG